MKAPHDEFDAIYQQLKPKPTLRSITLVASMSLLALMLWFHYQPAPSDNSYINQLQSQISLMEHNLNQSRAATKSIKSTAEYENQLMLQQWLSHINNELQQSQSLHKTQRLLKAKWALLNDLKQPSTQPLLI